ncbi:MAG: metallophosphoesterase family protein [Proteobacteria bacterium]|nr:metallophosphoesterase family protein [Pseudomonadota bacterium]
MPRVINLKEIRDMINLVKRVGFHRAAKELGKNYHAVYMLYKRYTSDDKINNMDKAPFVIQDIPDDELTTEELIERSLKRWERKREAHNATKLIDVDLKEKKPFALCFIGDPHIDDDGCNWGRLKADMDLMANTPGMIGICVGDITNNWVGRLMKKYADQETTRKQAEKLIEWFLSEAGVYWAAVIGGNHDIWNTDGGDINKFIFRSQAGIYRNHGVRLKLKIPGGKTINVNCRHDYAGHSQWNESHAMSKAARFGVDDIYVAGHRHVSGYQIVKNHESQRISHAVRVAGYKEIDDYAESKSLREHNIFQSMAFIVDPGQEDPLRFIKPVFSLDEAAEELTYKRKVTSNS